jgi:hypothetical protein
MAVETYEVIWNGTLAGQFVQTVQHVQATIAVPVNPFASALLIAQDLEANGINDLWLGMLPDDYKVTSLRVRKVSGAGGPTAILTQAQLGTFQGTRSGPISSAQANPLIVWIPTTSPDKTGRVFLPGVGEPDIDQMILIGALITEMQAFIAGWIAGGTLGGVDSYRGVVYRRARPLEVPPVVASTDVIFAGQVSPLIGTQRRRLHPV